MRVMPLSPLFVVLRGVEGVVFVCEDTREDRDEGQCLVIT